MTRKAVESPIAMQAFNQKLGKPTEHGRDIFSFTGKGSFGKWRPITLSRIEKLLLESEFNTHGLDGQYSYFLGNLISGFSSSTSFVSKTNSVSQSSILIWVPRWCK